MQHSHLIKTLRSGLIGAVVLLSLALLPIQVQAQGIGDAFKGFRSNSTDPIQIEATSFELKDKERVGIFRGNVDVKQATTRLKTAILKVYYSGDLTQGGSGNSEIQRLEAQGKVFIEAEGAVATGNSAWINLKTNKAELVGNVVLSQGDNVARGDKLKIDLTAGTSELVAGTSQNKGRIRLLLSPNNAKKLKKN